MQSERLFCSATVSPLQKDLDVSSLVAIPRNIRLILGITGNGEMRSSLRVGEELT